MIVNFHLVVTQNGSVRVVKNKPNLHWDEISMQLRLSIPDKVFERPQFTAELTVPDTAIQSTDVPIDLTAVQQVLEQTTGYEVKLSLVPKEEVTNG